MSTLVAATSLDTLQLAVSRRAERPAASRDVGRVLEALRGGQREALARLYDLLGAEMYALALYVTRSPEAAEDAVQDVFVKLASTWSRLPRARRPRAYLLRMVRNAAIDGIRRASREPSPADQADLEAVPASERWSEARLDVERYLSRLSRRQHEVVLLHQVLGLTFREVGDVMGIPTFTAASRHRAALRRLREWAAEKPL